MPTQDMHWLSLEKPWRIAVAMAWEAYVSGSVGVGAVMTDPAGEVVAVGRNRISDKEAPPGRLRSTYIAHAELDVLGQLERGIYRRHTLWTTLEPCPLCSMAIVTSNVGTVAFAAGDRLWAEISRLTELNEFIARRWPARRGPLDGPVSVFCELLPLFWFREHKPDGSVIGQYASRHPRLLALAETLGRDRRLADLKAHPVEIALHEFWTELAAVEPPPQGG